MAIRTEWTPDDVPQRELWAAKWDEWTDGSWWLLYPGDDFPERLTLTEIRERCYTAAQRRGMRAQTRQHTDDDGRRCLAVRFVKREQERPQRAAA